MKKNTTNEIATTNNENAIATVNTTNAIATTNNSEKVDKVFPVKYRNAL